MTMYSLSLAAGRRLGPFHLHVFFQAGVGAQVVWQRADDPLLNPIAVEGFSHKVPGKNVRQLAVGSPQLNFLIRIVPGDVLSHQLDARFRFQLL